MCKLYERAHYGISETFDGVLPVLYMDNVSILKVYNTLDESTDRICVRHEIKCTIFTTTEYERTSLFDPDHLTRVLCCHDDEGKRSMEFWDNSLYSGYECLARSFCQELCYYLSVRLSIKSLFFEGSSEFCMILDDTVVYDKIFFFCVGVGVSIFEGNPSMGCPPRMPYSRSVFFEGIFGLIYQ